MQSGRLRHRVTIEAKTTTPGTFGEPIETWTPAAERWAAVEPLQMREMLQAQQIDAQLSHRIVLRYYPGLSGEYRLVYGTRVFHIHAVRNLQERDRMLEVLATEQS